MPEQGSGLRLRQAREEAGLGIAEVAAKMRVPARVVESLEAEDWDRLGAAVFVRGQVRSYARALGLAPETLLPDRGVPPIEPPTLQPRTYTPRYQRLAEQAARRMVYVVITATLAVPVWMVTRGHMDSAPPETASLDVPVGTPGPERAADATGERPRAQQRPYVASMAPIQSRRSQQQPAADAEAAAPASPALSLQFSDDSWFEIRSHDGRQLEQALVRAGQERSYDAGEVGHVVLGNAEAVEVRRYGDVQDTGPFQRANVARFTVSSDGSLAAAAE